MTNKRGGAAIEWAERIGLVICFIVWAGAWGGGVLAYQLWQSLH